MEVTQTIEIDTSGDTVWFILDGEFDDISGWAARMVASEGDASLGPLGGRQVTTVEYGPATETIYRRDAEQRSLGYWVTGPSLPPPIADVQTEWRVADLGSDTSAVALRFLAVVEDPAAQPMLQEVLNAGITPLLEELKHYAETGNAHPNNTAAG